MVKIIQNNDLKYLKNITILLELNGDLFPIGVFKYGTDVF